MAKEDRIRRLMPLFEQGRIILPPTRFRTLYDRSTVNLIDAFVEEEYMAFPVAAHDDMLDCLARIEDPELKVKWPQSEADRRAHSSSRQQFANMGYADLKKRARQWVGRP